MSTLAVTSIRVTPNPSAKGRAKGAMWTVRSITDDKRYLLETASTRAGVAAIVRRRLLRGIPA